MEEEIIPEKALRVKEEEEEEEKKEKISPAEFFESLPPEIIKEFRFGLSAQRYSGPFPPQFFEKITEQHISRILDIAEGDEKRSFEDAKSSRKYTLCYVLIVAALFVFLTVFLVFKDVELYEEVLKILIIFLGGLGGGFGINEMIRRRS